MKKTFVYAVALAMTILSIYSCSNIEIATFEDCYKETAKISENCYVSVADTIQYYEKFGRKAVMNKLNDEIVKFCFGEQFAGKTVEESHKALSDSLRNDWDTSAISLINSDAFSEETAFFYIYEFMNVGSFDTPFNERGIVRHSFQRFAILQSVQIFLHGRGSWLWCHILHGS